MSSKKSLNQAIKILESAGFKVRRKGKMYILTEPIVGQEEEYEASYLIKMSEWYSYKSHYISKGNLKHAQKRRNRTETNKRIHNEDYDSFDKNRPAHYEDPWGHD